LNIHLNNLIDNILNNDKFALIPHNPDVDKDLKFLFEFFMNLNTHLIIKEVLKKPEHNGLEMAFMTISHYKGSINYYTADTDYKTYNVMKPFLDIDSKAKYNILFQSSEIDLILDGEILTSDNIDMQHLLINDITKFIDVSIKLNLNNLIEVFNQDRLKVFYWINNHNDKYEQLKVLNEPQFIFDNMNGKLDINNDSLKYFFEICPLDLKVYKELKKSIPIETIWKHTHKKLSLEFIIELVDTIEDIKFILSLNNTPLKTINILFEKIQKNYPALYSQLNSLLLLKNDFSQ
jgi:CRISPR/Cas system-associated endonuclease Cas3-HD